MVGLPDFTKPLNSASYSIGTVTSDGAINAITTEEVNTAGGAIARTLPLASANTGRLFRIIKSSADAYAVTIGVTSSDQILTTSGLVSSLTLSAQCQGYELICDGSKWVNLTPSGATFGVTPSTQAFGDSATEGTSGGAARGDHKHGMPALPIVPFIKSFTRDMTVASGDVAYTGIGFQPTALIIIAILPGSWGSVGSSDSAKNMVSLCPIVNASFNLLVNLGYYGSGTFQYAIIKSYDADGFTLTWTKGNSPTGTANLMVFAFK